MSQTGPLYRIRVIGPKVAVLKAHVSGFNLLVKGHRSSMHYTGFLFQFYTDVVVQMVIGSSVLHAFNVAVVTKVIILLAFHN